MEEALFFKAVGDCVYVKATGHITAAFCPELKSKCFARFDETTALAAVYLDLGECEYMDSTFLGLIVGLTKKLMAKTRKKVSIIGMNDTCLGLLKTIGVLGLVEVLGAGPEFPAGLERIGRGAVATAEFLLDAHEDLSSLSDENRAKFNALTTMLRESMKNPEDDKTGRN